VTELQARFLAAAVREVEHAVDHYQQHGGKALGERFLVQLQAVIDLIAAHPELGVPTSHGLRQLRLKRFPFSAVYGLRGQVLVIVAIAHHRRKPGYWAHRQA
jgi:toxin ParE1/3/4